MKSFYQNTMKHLTHKDLIFFLLIFSFITPFVNAQTDNLLSILRLELDREFTFLAKDKTPVYYIDYRVDDLSIVDFTASFGSLISDNTTKKRVLTTSVRIGDWELDQTHPYNGENVISKSSWRNIPQGDNPVAINQALWQNTDKAWREAVGDYNAKKNQMKNNEGESVPDFSREPVVRYFEPDTMVGMSVEMKRYWQDVIKQISNLFNANDSIIRGDVGFSYVRSRKYFLSTDSTDIVQNASNARLIIAGIIKTKDGNELPLYKTYSAFTPKGIPEVDVIYADAKKMVDLLMQLNHAVLAEPYSGPAILSPAAAGVFFHEIFGHRVEGHRMKNESDGHTFKSMIGERVLPRSFSVTFNPQQKQFNGADLLGAFAYDDQGVLGSKVNIVDAGILKSFLMSRCPIEGFANSNGHGRAQIGSAPVSRQSNMFVTTDKPLDDKKMRQMLIKECKKQKNTYGYYFKEVTGGFTQTGRYMPNAFNVLPTLVYRIYVDGRPDELVRGVNLIGTPLAMFSEIVSGGSSRGIFNGYCGAESGKVPVATVAPSLFVRKIETQKKAQKFGQFPILKKPTIVND